MVSIPTKMMSKPCVHGVAAAILIAAGLSIAIARPTHAGPTKSSPPSSAFQEHDAQLFVPSHHHLDYDEFLINFVVLQADRLPGSRRCE